jgi:branched-chain amino acid transport system ATP-binding protein
MTPLLAVQGLTVRYGSATAVSQATLTVEAGQLVGLIGPNGAGKTSLLDAVTGFTPIAEGKISFAGQDITRLPAHDRARLGLRRTWQAMELFDELSVLDNIEVSLRSLRWWEAALDIAAPRRRKPAQAARKALETMGLSDVADKTPPEISNSTRALVGVARALAAEPPLVLLDEPAASLDAEETRILGSRLRELVEQGISILLIDHDVGMMMTICDLLHVLDFGRIIASGSCSQVRDDPAVIAAYLGQSITGPAA